MGTTWSGACAVSGCSGMVRDQVEEGEEEDPDDVHEVPVEPGDLDGRVVGGTEPSVPRLPGHDRDDGHADHHVQGVQAGEAEVEGEEELGMPRGVRAERL